MVDTLTPERTAAHLCELSADARAAVLLDAAGSLAGASDDDPARARALGELARELFEAVDKATRGLGGRAAPAGGGAGARRRRVRLAHAALDARRCGPPAALSSLMLWDLRALLGELEGAPPIRRARAADEAARGPATDEQAAGELPLPELGGDDGERP